MNDYFLPTTLEGWAAVGGFVIAASGGFLAWRRRARAKRSVQALAAQPRRTAPPVLHPDWPEIRSPEIRLHRKTVGRGPELAALDNAFLATERATITPSASLTATGGMGKSTLARAYAVTRAQKYQGVWWVNAETPETTLFDDVDALGNRIGVAKIAQEKPLPRVQRIWAEVAARPHPWLIVFDNAPDYTTVEQWLPSGERVHLLITSREKTWRADLFQTLEVGRLPEDQAVELLTQEAGRHDDPAGALALARALHCFPLALVQAGAYAAETTLPFDACRQKVEEIYSRNPPDGYPHSVYATVEMTMARIEANAKAGEEAPEGADRGAGADELTLLSLLPWLAPEGIDAGLVLDVADEDFVEGSEADIPHAIRALAEERARLQAAISALGRRSLARVEGAGRDRMVALHRITAQILRARDAGQADARRRAAAAVVAASYPGGDRNPEDIAQWDACRRLNPHVAALAAPPAVGADDTPTPPASAAMEFLLNQASIFHRHQAATDIAPSYARKALALTIARLGPDHPEVGSGHVNLGLALGVAGAWAEAVTEMREALRIAEAQGPNFPLLGNALSNFAWALMGKLDAAPTDADAREARLREVESLFCRAYKHDRRLHGALHDETATRLSNLAATYGALGDLRRARRIGALALATRREVLAPDDPRLAFSLNNLGGYHLKDQAPDRALPLLEEALDIREAAFADNPRHPHRIDTARWLALCRLAQRAPDVAGAAALCEAYGLDYDAHAREAQHYRPQSP